MSWTDIVTVGGKARVVSGGHYVRAAAQGDVIAWVDQSMVVRDTLGHVRQLGAGEAFGTNCVGILAVPGGGWDVVWMLAAEQGATYARAWLSATLEPIGSIQTHRNPHGGTSQGFLDVALGTEPVWTDQHRTRQCGPVLLGLWMQRGPWVIGQDWTRGVDGLSAWHVERQQAYIVTETYTPTPSHLTLEADGTAVVLPALSSTPIRESAFRPWAMPAFVDEPECVVPTFDVPAHPVRIRIFLEDGYDPPPADVFPARDGMPAMVFMDLGWSAEKQATQEQRARDLGAELGVYADETAYPSNAVPWIYEDLTVVPLQQCYPHRELPALTGRLQTLEERQEQISDSLDGIERQWHGPLGVTMAAYRQVRRVDPHPEYNWPLQQVLDLAGWTWQQVCARRIDTVTIFVQRRGRDLGGQWRDGIESRPELREMVRRIQAAAAAYQPAPPVVAELSDLLLPGASLVPERAGAEPSTYCRVSKGGRYRLIVLGDGHVVLQDLQADGATVWDSGWWCTKLTNQRGVGNLVPEGQRAPLPDGVPPHSGLTAFGDLAYLVTQDGRLAAIGTVGGVIAYADTGWHLEQCGRSATFSGNTYSCELPIGHDGMHQSAEKRWPY